MNIRKRYNLKVKYETNVNGNICKCNLLKRKYTYDTFTA